MWPKDHVDSCQLDLATRPWIARWPDEDGRNHRDREPCDETMFDPGNLADGIGYPPDEIFAVRRIAYGLSLSSADNKRNRHPRATTSPKRQVTAERA